MRPQIQAAVAEYERTRIRERARRGKVHAARNGQVSVLSRAPYGYRYIDKRRGGGKARYEVVPEEAEVVRQIFRWVGEDRWSTRQVCDRLQELKIRAPSGAPGWAPETVAEMLRRTAYQGLAGYGNTQRGQRRERLRPRRGQPEVSRCPTSVYRTPGRAIPIPVPALVGEDLFSAVAEQLEENRRKWRGRRGAGNNLYLLSGLAECGRCGYALCGRSSGKDKGGSRRRYSYYRCCGGDRSRFGGERVCDARAVRADLLEEAVWKDVCALLRDPHLVEREYQRREGEKKDGPAQQADQRRLRIGGLTKKLGRLIDAYTEGLINKEEFEPRAARLRQELKAQEVEEEREDQRRRQQQELRLVLGCLEEFAARVRVGLEEVDASTKRTILRKLIRKVVIDHDEVTIIYRVGLPPFDGSPTRGILPHCLERHGQPPGHGAPARAPPRALPQRPCQTAPPASLSRASADDTSGSSARRPALPPGLESNS